MCSAPAATCRRMSSSTTSALHDAERRRGRPAPPGNGGTGACSRGWPRCSPRGRVPPFVTSCAYAPSGGRPVAVRHQELLPLRARSRRVRPSALASRRARSASACSNSPPMTVSTPARPQQLLVQRRIQPVSAQVRPRDSAACTRSITRRNRRVAVCMGRKNAIRSACSTAARGQRAAREVGQRHLVAVGAQPRRRRRQPERLPAQLVGGDQDDPHCFHYDRSTW